MKTKIHTLVLALSFGILKGQTTLSFSSTTYGVDAGPRSVAIADFNNDNKKDIAVANIFGQSISILLGNGTGGFTAGTPINVGYQAFFLLSGDFNADGKYDLAVTCTNDDKTVIINGNGDGTFSGSPTLFTITYPQGIVYSDFDGDGKKDLAVAAMDAFNTNGEVYLMLANNSGGFSAPTEFLTSNQTYTLIAGDLNGDSKMDLAVCDYIGSNNHIVFLMGNGLGSFGTAIPFAGATYTYSFAIGDFNQDTKTDLVAAYSEENNLAFMAGNGTGNFSTPGLLSTGAATTPYTVASADLNSDGKPDLISSNYASANISVLLNTGSGNFGSALNFATGNAPFHVASDDLNADGKPDLVVANNLSDNITVLINTSTIGIKDADALSQTVTVFPNPILSLLNLNVSNPLHNATVKCIDVTGKLVMEKNQLSGNSFRFDLSAVKAGMYFLQLYNNNELISTSKIFKAE